MATIKIYGASDDLVEVEGDAPGCDEFNTSYKPLYIELSTEDVFKVEYTDAGVWKVRLIYPSPNTPYSMVPHGTGDDPEPVTDTVTVTGPIEWVDVWEDFPPTPGEKRTKIARALTGDDELGRNCPLNDDDVDAVYAIVANASRRKP